MYFPSYLGNEQMSVHVLTMDHLNLDLLKSILLPDDRFSNFKMQIKAQNVSLYLVKDEFSSLTAFRWKITISETDAFFFRVVCWRCYFLLPENINESLFIRSTYDQDLFDWY